MNAPRRRRLFFAAALALPWIALGLLELGLRAGGYGSAYPLFVHHQTSAGLAVNQAVGWRYFGDGPFRPTPELDLFQSDKTPGTYRIFVQGESTAQGFPYGHGGAPSRMLEQRLQAAFPEWEVEVVNTALTAVSSWTLLDQADEIIAQEPDAVVIYTGHNEFYGAFGVGSTTTLGRWRPLVKTYLMMRHVRTAQLLADLLSRIGDTRRGKSSPDAPRTVMQLMAGEQRVPLDSPRYREGLDQFRANLGELLARYQRHGIPVLIGTLASNERDQPPFISGLAASTDSAAWWRDFHGAAAALARGDTEAATHTLEALVHTDNTAAIAHYALARLHDARGDTVRAHTEYRAAKDRDQLRFRASEAFNGVIRDEAARHGATVVETQGALERHAPGGTIGKTLMLEHLHPNLDGYFIIADAFFDILRQRAPAGPPAPSISLAQARADIPITEVDSVIGLLRTDRLVSGWPFQPRGGERIPIVDTLHPVDQVQHLAQAVVVGNLPWPEATERLRTAAERAGNYDQSIRAARALAAEYSYSPEPYTDAARVALLQRRYDEALRYITEANERRETADGVHLAGLLMLRQGDHADALRCLRRAVQLDPNDERMKLALGAAGAIPELERRHASAPRDTNVLYDLGGAYALTQQYEKARDALTKLIRLAPSHAGARTLIARLPQ